MHKDPYENIYCVISGEKEFTLHPPTDLPWIPYEKYQSAIYKKVNNNWKIDPIESNGSAADDDDDDDKIPWVSVDPLKPDYQK